jgi:two-component system NarL family sensor kinase
LFGAHLALRVAREGGDEQRTTAAIDRGAELVEQAMGELRGLVELLRAADLEQGLAPALRRLAERIDGPVRVHLDADRHLDVPVEVADAAHRTVQEATHNALRHAEADNIWLRVGRAGDRLLVRIDDDGRGFPEPVQAGVGLTSISDRAEAARGTARFGSRPEGGARVEVELPWPR